MSTAQDYTYPIDDDDNNTIENNNNQQSQQVQQKPQTENKSEWDKYLDTLDQARLEELAKLAKLSKYTIEGKEYTRQKIRVKQFHELERLRAKFSKEKDPIKSTEYLIDVYAKCAEYYLGIDRDTYEEMDWEITKPIIDACNFRSVRGLPN